MKYKRYTGVVELEEGSDVLFGRVIGLRDVITFQGESVAEVTQAFHDSVDDYLDFCAERGESPEMAYSGQLVLRLDPEVHGQLAELAERRSMSLNALIDAAVRKALWLDVQERLGMRTESEPATVMIKVAEERPSALEKARKMVESRERGAKKRTEHQAAIRVTARKRVAEVKKRAAERKAASATSLDKAERIPNKLRQLRLREKKEVDSMRCAAGAGAARTLAAPPQLDCRPGGRVAAGPTERQRPSEKGSADQWTSPIRALGSPEVNSAPEEIERNLP